MIGLAVLWISPKQAGTISKRAIQGEADQPEYRHAAKDIKDGLGQMLPAARTRANAVYYGFIVLSIGLIVMVSLRAGCVNA